jgi:hypothetical protein
MYRWSYGEPSSSKRRSKPSKMSDRSASSRRCSTTASGRESFPRSAGSPGSAETPTTLGPIQIALVRAAGQTPNLNQAVDQVTSSKTRSDQQETKHSPVRARCQLNSPRSASSAPPRGCRNHSRRSLWHVLRAENPSGRLAPETAVPQAAPGTRCDESPVRAHLSRNGSLIETAEHARPGRATRCLVGQHGVMTAIKINAITVPRESGDELACRLATRTGVVHDAEGFGVRARSSPPTTGSSGW